MSASKSIFSKPGTRRLAAPGLIIAVLGLVPASASAQAQQTPAAAPAAPAGPVKTETTPFDQWVLTCQEQPPAAGAKTGKKICWATMQVTDSKTSRVVLVWRLGRDAKDAPTVAVTTPTGVTIPDGVTIALGKSSRRLDYQRCSPSECEAAGPYDQAFANELAGNGEATVTFRLLDGRQASIKVSTKGADKVLAGLKK